MPKLSISNTLTDDNLPALMAPQECPTCNGSGTINNSALRDPLYDEPCPECAETGLVPYPGTFAEQRKDFHSEIIDGIAACLLESAQRMWVSYDPDEGRFSMTIGSKYYTHKHEGSCYHKETLTEAADGALNAFNSFARNADIIAAVDKEVEELRLKLLAERLV